MGHVTERRTVTREEDVIVEVRCDNCKVELTPVFPTDDGHWKNLQPHDALEIVLIGFYGGYFDSCADWVGVQHPRVWLCKVCADKFTQEWPVFRKAIDGSY